MGLAMDTGPTRAPSGIRGWLLLLCAMLILWQPFSIAFVASGALRSLTLRGVGLALILVVRLLAAALGIAAGLALLGRRAGAVRMAKASLAASAAVDLIVYTTPYFPNNRPPGSTIVFVFASLVYYAGWFAYLSFSRRVRATFNE
jgi:hypothetical protein